MNLNPGASKRPTGTLAAGAGGAVIVALTLALSGCGGSRSGNVNIASSTRESIADIAAAGGDMESARSILAAAAQADPNNADLQLRYALAQLQSGRPDDAIGTARRTVEQHAQDTRIAVRAAQLELRAGDPALAEATFLAALAHGASGTPVLNGLGVARVQLGDLPGAEEAFRKAISTAPGDYAARNNLALALVLQGRADEAVPMLQSLAEEPGVPDRVRHNLALAFARQGDLRQAATVLSEAVGSSAASREVAALSAVRSQAPIALASRLAPVQVLEGRTSGIPYAGPIPGPIVRQSAATSPAPEQTAEAAPPVQLHAAPLAPVQAAPVAPPVRKAPPAPKLASAQAATSVPPPPAPSPAPAATGDAPTPNVITPTDPPLADPGVAPVAPAAVPASVAGAPPALPPSMTNITVFEPAEDGTVKVRIAAVPSRSAALTLWRNLVGMEPDLFSGRTPLVRQAKERGHPAWHLGTGGFQTVAAAEQFCRLLRARGPNCRIGL